MSAAGGLRPQYQGRLHGRGKCRICGCTDDRACPIGCIWVDEERTLCSTCDRFIDALGDYAGMVHSVSKASLGRMLDEVHLRDEDRQDSLFEEAKK